MDTPEERPLMDTEPSPAYVQQTRDAYAAFVRGDIAAVLTNHADDIEWIIPGPPDLPFAGVIQGKHALQDWIGRYVQTLDFQRFEPYAFIGEGDTVVILIHVVARMRHNGQEVVSEEAHVDTYREGKVARFQVFFDTAAYVDAFRG